MHARIHAAHTFFAEKFILLRLSITIDNMYYIFALILLNSYSFIFEEPFFNGLIKPCYIFMIYCNIFYLLLCMNRRKDAAQGRRHKLKCRRKMSGPILEPPENTSHMKATLRVHFTDWYILHLLDLKLYTNQSKRSVTFVCEIFPNEFENQAPSSCVCALTSCYALSCR
jgi:hypothetical protein